MQVGLKSVLRYTQSMPAEVSYVLHGNLKRGCGPAIFFISVLGRLRWKTTFQSSKSFILG